MAWAKSETPELESGDDEKRAGNIRSRTVSRLMKWCQGRDRVARDQREQPVGQPKVNILRLMVDRTIRLDPEIDREQAKIEDSGVPHEGDNPDQGSDEHHRVDEQVSRMRYATRDLAHFRRQLRRRMRAAPQYPGQQQHENQQPDLRVDIDPEQLAGLRPTIEQETENP